LNIEKYISSEAQEKIRHAISESGGNEVFLVGYTEEDLVVHEVDVVARGNKIAVPAVLNKARDADVVIHNHPSGALTPSDADLAIASHLDSFSVGFYIVDNTVNDIYVVVEPFAREEITHLDESKIEELLRPGGAISRHLKGYEERGQQIDMVSAVCQAFNQNKVATIEAGTGTGKTMAYLLPAIYWSLKNKERVVISTNTINLQEQLVHKDIPLLQKALNEKFDAVLVKGRSNYACLRKVDDVASELNLHADEDAERDELKQLIGWAKNSADGSKADLATIPSANVWEKIAAESDTCTRSKCRHFRECFINKARRKASRAHILVVNHHLLFADLALKYQKESFADTAVLPPYHRIIFDEAHHIEDVATNYFGSSITGMGIVRMLNKLFYVKKSIPKGLLVSINRQLQRQRALVPRDLFDKVSRMMEAEIVPDIQSTTEKTHDLMDLLFDSIRSLQQDDDKKEYKLRLLPHVYDRLFIGGDLQDAFKDYTMSLKSLGHRVYRLLEQLIVIQSLAKADWSSLLIEIKAQAERVAIAADTIEDVLFQQDENHIRWLEAKEGYKSRHIIRFKSSPLDVSGMMVNAAFEPFGTVLLTSATLTVNNQFNFLSQRIGLDKLSSSRRTELILPAPFDYQKQVIMAMPSDVPDPRHPTFAQEVSKLIFRALTISEGRAFILFTSYRLLNLVYSNLFESLNMLGLTPLKQGSANRHELLKKFRKDKKSVLFATDSFWEGVDVEGDALESVIIPKLPFKVPDEPIIEARYEAIERQGGNAFMEYAVPMAVLKLKQGFGRLVRRKTDRGCVIIFDSRITQKAYGKTFLRSLPECHTATGNREKVFEELKDFFAKPRLLTES
jgi:ATP-dependent DNA helicase DinG